MASKIANILSVFLVFYMVYKNTILGFSLIGLMLFPGMVLALTLFSLNFLGDGLRDALDVRVSKD